MTMTPAIPWIRKRQRALARAALALFTLAWLQAAVVPCTMAFATEHATPAVQLSHGGAHEGHAAGHAGHAGHESPAPQTGHCPYCPPAQDGSVVDCDHEAECTFPHDPRMDARALTAIFGPPPSHYLELGSGLAPPVLRISASDSPSDVPRRSFAISYCRFIE